MDIFTEGVRENRSEYATETRCRWSNESGEMHTLVTAGNILQTRWRKIHGFEQEEDLGNQWCQAWTSNQLRLPQLIHGAELGEEVAQWAPQQLADHTAAATLILTPTLLHAFLSLQVRLYQEQDEVSGLPPSPTGTMHATSIREDIRKGSSKVENGPMHLCTTPYVLCMPPPTQQQGAERQLPLTLHPP